MSVIFAPTGATVNVASPSATSESVALSAFSGVAGAVVRVFNGSNQLQFVAFGGSGVTAAAATSLPIAAGAVEYIGVSPAVTHAAVIEGAASTGNVYFTSGQAR